MDKKDLKILYALDKNGRSTATDIAKFAGLSKQGFNYRFNKLIDDKIISGVSSLVYIEKIGFFKYRVFLRYKNVDKATESKIIAYFKNIKEVIWMINLIGSWDLEVVFSARNFIHFDNIFKRIKNDIGKYFSKYHQSLSVVSYRLDRDYLINKKRGNFKYSYEIEEPEYYPLDKIDIGILNELVKDSRQNSMEIGNKLNISYHTVKDRIKKLEKNRVILSHYLSLNMEKYKKLFYKAIFVLNNPSKKDENELYSFIYKYNFVTYIIETLGDWQLELEAEADEEQFVKLIKDLRYNFPELILDYDILRMTNEYKIKFFPL
jgi:DNA-binding Lrp family transcriptional regulator